MSALSKRLRRWSRPLRHGLAFAGLQLLIYPLRRLPLSFALSTGEQLGRFIGRFARRTDCAIRRRLDERLSSGAGERVAPLLWASLGRRAVELIIADRLLPLIRLGGDDRKRLEESLAEATADGRGILCLTAHYGNWELLGARLAQEGYPFAAVAAALKASPLSRWLNDARRSWGVETIHPGGGAQIALRRLQRGEHVALLIDLATRERGCVLPLLGAPARCAFTAPRLAHRCKPVLLWLWNERRVGGGYQIRCERLSDELFHSPEAGLLEVNRRLEGLLCAHPEEWIWLHERWGD